MIDGRSTSLPGVAHPPGSAIRGWLLSLALVGALLPRLAASACLVNTDPDIRQSFASVARNPNAGLAQVQTGIAALARVSPVDTPRLAALYAVEAAAYGELKLDDQARQAALAGLALVPLDSDPIHLDLLGLYADNAIEAADMDGLIARIQAVRAAHAGDSAADVCLLIALGRLQFREEHPAQAVSNLTQAYRASTLPVFAEARIAAASALSAVLGNAHDYREALDLNQEVIDWNTAHGLTAELSASLYRRGGIFGAQHDFALAIAQYAKARQISASIQDVQGVGVAEMSTCEAYIELNELAAAGQSCRSAAHIFAESRSGPWLKQTQALRARIELAGGHADRALRLLDSVLDRGGADLPPRQLASIYYARSRSEAALQDYPSAYEDLEGYLRRYSAQNALDRSEQAAVATARFDTDREIAQNSALRRELTLATERLELRKRELTWTIAVIALVSLVMALLMRLLISNHRYRRELQRLAGQDGLTGLPNRRLTAEKATAALAAAAGHRPVSMALIDLDHFKSINDRYGHAVGDHVLREFAQLARKLLRSTDTLGRWGGEEFLLILPDTTIDAAVATVHRMRAATAEMPQVDAACGLVVSFSAGIASRSGTAQSLDEVIACADAALYEAKRAGRNLVRLDPETHRSAESGVLRTIYTA
jgi:diguanylate cyclase (GGDEF)-like protein